MKKLRIHTTRPMNGFLLLPPGPESVRRALCYHGIDSPNDLSWGKRSRMGWGTNAAQAWKQLRQEADMCHVGLKMVPES